MNPCGLRRHLRPWRFLKVLQVTDPRHLLTPETETAPPLFHGGLCFHLNQEAVMQKRLRRGGGHSSARLWWAIRESQGGCKTDRLSSLYVQSWWSCWFLPSWPDDRSWVSIRGDSRVYSGQFDICHVNKHPSNTLATTNIIFFLFLFQPSKLFRPHTTQGSCRSCVWSSLLQAGRNGPQSPTTSFH